MINELRELRKAYKVQKDAKSYRSKRRSVDHRTISDNNSQLNRLSISQLPAGIGNLPIGSAMAPSDRASSFRVKKYSALNRPIKNNYTLASN